MTLDARIKVLQRGTLFSSVPEGDLAVLAESMNEEAFAAGETVCVRGEPADRIFVVASGRFDVRPGGDHAVTLAAGELFGEYGLFDQGLRTATIVASEPGTLLTLDYPRFRAFLLMFPEAMLAILGATVGQLLAYQRRLDRPA
ncbi:MAG: hypothetical protein BroJett024_38060 [Alphaproteobacteria bacterium]|nr:MAG: hypothetical protein BroJett024_38060 [Alphaproteobacteria bacterium]